MVLDAQGLYNESFYLAQNPDVAAAVESGVIGSGFEHFIESGQFQVRQPSPLYDEGYYLTANPDVVNAIAQGFFLSGFQHFISLGQFENRDPSAIFDTEYYLSENPDVADIVNQGLATAIEHFVSFGQFEDRSPTPLYNSEYYLSQNLEAAFAVAQDDLTGIQYYLDTGAAKNQEFSAFLDADNSAFPNRVAVGDVTQNSAVFLARSVVAGSLQFSYATDPNFNNIVGVVDSFVSDLTEPVKVEVTNLTPNTQYFYRVTTAESPLILGGQGGGLRISEVGSFRTPAPLGTQQEVRFGATAESQGQLAPNVAIANVPERNLDFFVQLGNTISADTESPDLPTVQQASNLLEFRTKYNEVYSQNNNSNPWSNLRASTPIYATWNDQELTNNFAGGTAAFNSPQKQGILGNGVEFVNQTPAFNSALEAFQEYQPLRNEYYGDTDDPRTAFQRKLYRFNTFGTSAATFLLDVRSFRDAPLPSLLLPPTEASLQQFELASFDPNRTMLGDVQLEELKTNLLEAENAGLTWKFIFSPVPMQNLGVLSPQERWEGYAAERTELLQFIDENNIDNVVFISGDAQGTLVNNLTYQSGVDQPQISTDTFEITVGPTAFQTELAGESFAAPFGPQFVAFTPDDLLSQDAKDYYFSLDNAIQKDDYLQTIVNESLSSFGYDNPIGLDDSSLNAELLQGSYFATHAFSWTEFVIEPQTQQLKVTVYGIEPYTSEDVTSTPAAILNRQPQVISQFIVNPQSL